MDTRTPRADEGALEVQAKDPILAGDRARCRDGRSRTLARIADQRRQAPRGAVATVRAGNGAHAVGCRLIIEQHTAAAVDLQIDETGSQERTGRNARLRPIGWDLTPGSKAHDAPVPDHHGGFAVPAMTVKNAVREDCVLVGAERIV